jgi:hypothetical protein
MPAGHQKYAKHMLGPGLPFTYLSFNSQRKVRPLPHIVITLTNCYFARYLPSHSLPAITLTTCHHTCYLPSCLLTAIALATCHCAQIGSGLFRSELILTTLAFHFIATNTLDDDMRSTENPEGALLLSVVAVRYIPIFKSLLL